MEFITHVKVKCMVMAERLGREKWKNTIVGSYMKWCNITRR